MSYPEKTAIQKEQILNLTYQAIDEVNETLPEEKRAPKSLETPLLGAHGTIDSLGLTMFIVALEKRIEEDMGVVLTLVDGTTMSEENSPFQTVATLVEHIAKLVEEKVDV